MIGFFNIYKPKGVSSAFVVNKIKKHFNIKKIGHMGTLDPLAVGVLPIAIGKATRMFDYLLKDDKTYHVTAQFGYETPSLDLGTEISRNTNVIPTKSQIDESCKIFLGKINQMPPAYSAKKIDGNKAYDLARAGIAVKLKKAQVEVYSFICDKQIDNSTFSFIIKCSSGTYVRSLINDLATSLNSLATTIFLERVQSGYFEKNNSIMLDEFLKLNSYETHLIEIEDVFCNIDIVNVDDNAFFKLKNGISIKLELPNNLYFINNNNNLLGIGEVNEHVLMLKTYLLNN